MVHLKVIQVGAQVVQLPTAKKIVPMIDSELTLASLLDLLYQKVVKKILSNPRIRNPYFDNKQKFYMFQLPWESGYRVVYDLFSFSRVTYVGNMNHYLLKKAYMVSNLAQSYRRIQEYNYLGRNGLSNQASCL